MDPLTQLRDRPSHEQAIATYTTMQQEIQDAVTAAVPTVAWQPDRDALGAGCAEPFDNLGGETLVLPSVYAEGAIPDDTWLTAVAAAARVAQRYGLTDIITVVDRPADHQVRFANPADDTYVDLGTGVNVVLGTGTGCHLPADSLSTPPPATS